MKMKLSDAIRKGCESHEASQYGWADKSEVGKIRTCALLAAFVGEGLLWEYEGLWNISNLLKCNREAYDLRSGQPNPENTVSIEMPLEWGRITAAQELPPCECKKFGVPDMVMTIIWHLHDLHRWSREAVAEWIGTIEEKVAKRIAQEEAATLSARKEIAEIQKQLAPKELAEKA